MPEASSSVSPDISSVRRRRRRGLSVPASACPQICHHPLTPSLEALDLSTLSPTQALASLRFLVLSYLADLETCLAKLESVDLGITATLKASGELTIDEARQWARIGLEMLEVIRAGVRSHIPEFHFAEMSVETFKSHLPDVPGLTEMRTHLPDVHLPSLHDFPTIARHAKMSTIKDVRSHLPDFDFTDMRSKLDDVRSRIHDIDFHQPLSYVPVLLDRLHSLHSHLSSMQIPSGLSMTSAEPSTLLLNLLDELLTSNILSELLPSPEAVAEGEEMLGNAAKQIASALRASLGGSQLISYVDLPEQWRDNPFVAHGYRLAQQHTFCVLSTNYAGQIHTTGAMATYFLVSFFVT
jgi:adiponectin receptor